MKVEVIQHPVGERIPLILDAEGFPVAGPNEWLISRRELSANTLIRNARELVLLVEWLDQKRIDLEVRIRSDRMFTEAELKGSLIEKLRHSVQKPKKVPGDLGCVPIRGGKSEPKVPVAEDTFNQRLMTIKAYLVWSFGLELGRLSSADPMFGRVRMHQTHVESIFDNAFIAQTTPASADEKALTDDQLQSLKHYIYYCNPEAYGVSHQVKFRNYICVMIMLFYGLRPGELLSMKVGDIVFGRISELRVCRRPADPEDTRRPAPKVKRLARQLPIDEQKFARELDLYITDHREAMMERGNARDHDYLIVSDEGEPLHLNSLSQFFRILRERFSESLPSNLSAKMLRHTFSSQLERSLVAAGYDENHRRQALAALRGDSSLESQDVYIRQEIVRQSKAALKKYHDSLTSDV